MIRQTAYKLRISDLLDGNYIVEDGWEPNYVKLKDRRKAARVNILCTIISKEDDKNVILDDGSGQIRARSFEENPFGSIAVGTVVLIIGRPREYAGERYIVPEIVKVINDAKWLNLRKEELKLSTNVEPFEEKTAAVEEEAISIIRSLDKGEGADTEEVIKQLSHGEEKVKKLLEQGEIFEVRPGRVKVLE